jgi:hypothetical protein
MIEVKIETDEELMTYEFPGSWDEVTVKQFCDIYTHNFENYNEFESSIVLLSIISGIERDIIEMMDVDDFKMLLDKLKFIRDEVVKIEVDSIKIGEDEYFLQMDFDRFTTGEIITIELILEKANNNLFKVISELLCVFLRKKTVSGKLEKFKTSMLERKTMFESVKIAEIYHIFSFFLTGKNLLTNNTRDYTEKTL